MPTRKRHHSNASASWEDGRPSRELCELLSEWHWENNCFHDQVVAFALAHREQLLERASNTLESVMAAQAAQQRAGLQSLAAEEEASFEKRVKRAGACTLSCYCMSSVCVSLSLFLSFSLSLPR